jgi:hypothetical protein
LHLRDRSDRLVLDVLLLMKMDEMQAFFPMKDAKLKMKDARKDDHYLVALVDHYYVDALPLLLLNNFPYFNFILIEKNKKGALINKRPFL